MSSVLPHSSAASRGRLGIAVRHDPKGDHAELRRLVRIESFQAQLRRLVEQAPGDMTAVERSACARFLASFAKAGAR